MQSRCQLLYEVTLIVAIGEIQRCLGWDWFGKYYRLFMGMYMSLCTFETFGEPGNMHLRKMGPGTVRMEGFWLFRSIMSIGTGLRNLDISFLCTTYSTFYDRMTGAERTRETQLPISQNLTHICL